MFALVPVPPNVRRVVRFCATESRFPIIRNASRCHVVFEFDEILRAGCVSDGALQERLPVAPRPDDLARRSVDLVRWLRQHLA